MSTTASASRPSSRRRTSGASSVTRSWAFAMLHSKRWSFGNYADKVKSGNVKEMAELVKSQLDSSFDVKTLEWVRSLWPGKLMVKGIMDVEDAKMAIEGRRRRDTRIEPRRPPARQRAIDRVDPDRHRRRCRRQHRSLCRQRRSLGPRRAQIPRPRGARLLHRPRVPLRPRRLRPGGCHQSARNPQGRAQRRDGADRASPTSRTVPRDIILRGLPAQPNPAEASSGGPFRDVRVYEES